MNDIRFTCLMILFALETYGALSDRSDRVLVEFATLASRQCAGSGPSVSLFVHMVSTEGVDCIAPVASTCDTCKDPSSRAIHGRVTSPTTAGSTFFFGVVPCR